MSGNLRIILDTNVLIDGARDEYSPGFKIINWVLKGELTAVVSSRIVKEARLIMRRKLDDREYRDLVEEYFSKAERIGRPPRLKLVERDRQDNKFFEAAAAADVDYIISSDNHLLDVSHYQQTVVLKPEEFVNNYERLKDEMNI